VRVEAVAGAIRNSRQAAPGPFRGSVLGARRDVESAMIGRREINGHLLIPTGIPTRDPLRGLNKNLPARWPSRYRCCKA